jgi:16S rRNA (cytidine1402-2'-O)-methyltransferase
MNDSGISLYLIPTILAEGTQNNVLSPQINEAVQHLDVFFVENIRTARRFISSLKLGKVIDELTFIELNKDTPEAETVASLRNFRKVPASYRKPVARASPTRVR